MYDHSIATPVPRIEHPLEDGWTLPASWYTDLGVHELERERLFARAWTYAGPAEWVARARERTSPRTSATSPSPSSVARTATLRGLVNVCRHRGHLVVDGHRLPRDAAMPVPRVDLRPRRKPPPRAPLRARAGLRPGGAVARSGVRRTPGGRSCSSTRTPSAAPLEAALGDLPEIVAESGLDVGALRFHSHHEWPIEANWKVVMENFLECYHCPTAHPGFSKVIDVEPRRVRAPAYTRRSRARSPRCAQRRSRGTARRRTHRAATSSQAQYHFLFPSTTINIAPGIPNVSHGALQPGRPPPDDRGDRLLLRRRRLRRGDRRAHRLGHTGRRGGRLARAVRAARARVGDGLAGPAHVAERAADRGLPAPRARRSGI